MFVLQLDWCRAHKPDAPRSQLHPHPPAALEALDLKRPDLQPLDPQPFETQPQGL